MTTATVPVTIRRWIGDDGYEHMEVVARVYSTGESAPPL